MHKRLTSSSQKQNGQIVFAMVLCLIPLMLLLFNVFNTGMLVADKTRLQNAADSTVLAESAWVARSLNVMSMNNTALTQAHTITSTAFAAEGPVHRAAFTSALVLGFNLGRTTEWWSNLSPIYIGPIPVGKIIAAIIAAVYAAIAIDLTLNVIVPMMSAIGEINRAYANEQGFSRAAQGFARMNEIIAVDLPDQIGQHATSIADQNYAEATVVRYYGWSESATIDLPVLSQGVQGFFGSSQSDQQRNADNYGNFLDYINKLRDAWDLRTSGKKGTLPKLFPTDFADLGNNFSPPSFDHFANFRDQGYPVGTGPYPPTARDILNRFNPAHDALTAITKGAVGDRLSTAMNSALGGLDCPWYLDWACSLSKSFIRFFFNTAGVLFATIYEPAENDLDERLLESFDWATIYQESFYGWPAGASAVKLAAASGVGSVLAFKEGRDLTNLFDVVIDRVSDIASDINDSIFGSDETTADGETIEEREQRLNAILDTLNQPQDGTTTTGSTGRRRTNDREVNEAQRERGRANQAQQQGNFEDSDSGSGTDGYKEFRQYILWPYEVAYIFIALQFPADALAYPMKYVCSQRFQVGLLCTNTTPLYAVRNQRITPDVTNYLTLASNWTGQNAGQYTGALQNLESNLADTGLIGTRRDWSILVGMHAPLDLKIWEKGFHKGPEKITALAQAEIYNTQWYDLYTQSWRARLVPASVLKNEDHLSSLKTAWNSLSTGTDDSLVEIFNIDTLTNSNWDSLIRH